MKTFGLIGFPLSHSFSQKYFTEKFNNSGIDGMQYLNFPLENIGELRSLLSQQENLCGLNVTLPYKEQVISYLDSCNEIVKEIGACNCIKIKDGKLYGFNTDVEGFMIPLQKKLRPHHTRALVLGEGGASRAVTYVLKQLGITYLTVSRRGHETPDTIQYYQLNDEMMEEFSLIVNTTPLGMYPNIEQAPQIPYDALTPRHYLFDLVYNPAKTLFLSLGEEKGALIENGMDMLSLQAEASWRIWNDERI